MHIAVTSVPAAGHVNPTLPVVRELTRRGHTVTYATHEHHRSEVEAAGAELLSLPGQMPRPNPEDPDAAAQQLGETLRADFAVLREAFTRDPPQAICYDMMTAAGWMASAALGIPGVSLVPTHASNEHFSLHRDVLQAATTTAMPPGHLEMFDRVKQVLAEIGAETGVDTSGIFEGEPSPLNIVFLPREFQYSGETFDERFRFVGPSVDLRTGEDWSPARPGGPVLFISLGTAFNDRPEFFRACLEAFGGSGWQVALALGERVDPSDLGDVPDNIELRTYFPQPAVLRHADVFLSHAGMNSTMEAIHFGVPLVAAPQMPEQEANARQVDALGLGRHLAEFTAESLRRSVEEVHADTAVRANIARMGELLRGCGGAVEAADALEGHLAAVRGAA
ncbi:macrolide family glycosyltransferase [Salinifilum ghardaiensis]